MYLTGRYRPNHTISVKKRYKLISKFVLVKQRSIPFCIGEYWTILVFSVKYRPLYTNLDKISKFCTLIVFIFWNSKWYESDIVIHKSSMSRCGKQNGIMFTLVLRLCICFLYGNNFDYKEAFLGGARLYKQNTFWRWSRKNKGPYLWAV